MNGDIPEFKRRYRYMVIIVCLTFAVIVGRLWQVQMLHGKRFQKASEDNFVQVVRIASVRGLVMDRRRRPLNTNRPSYNVYVTPRFTNEDALDRLIQELSLAPQQSEELRYRLGRVEGEKRYHPMLGFGKFESAARFCEAFDELRQYFRVRCRGGQHIPLAEQRGLFITRWRSLIAEMAAA